MNTNTKILALALGLLSTEIAWKIWKVLISRRKNSNALGDQRETDKKNGAVTEILMFTEHCQLCRDHANTRIPCNKEGCPVYMVRRIQTFMESASKTLDLCMYVMTCDDLTKSIIGIHRRGVNVRVVADAGMSENTACAQQILRMRRAGIKIRTNSPKPSSLMHHKFVIIDNRIILFGSTNWTMQAFYGNYDSIAIMNEQELVKPYSKAFEKMWLEFE